MCAIRLYTSWLGVKDPLANAEGAGSASGLGRTPGGGNGYPLQYSCLANPVDRGAWWATVLGVVKSWTRLSVRTRAFEVGAPGVAGGEPETCQDAR